MKKMRKFAWIFMAAMTVAGFSACSNSEDEDLPTGGDGGEGGNPSTPSVVVKDTIYQFNNIEADFTPINELCPGWTHEIISPSDDDRTWKSKTFNNTSAGVTEKYIQATAYSGDDSNAGLAYDWWMISPALNVKDAAKKVFSFYSEGAYWQSSTKLEVYVMNEPKSTASSKELLNVTLATSAAPGGNFKGWVASGDINLEGKGDIVYIGFHYTAEDGNGKSTTYCIDDFAFGRNQVEHFLGEAGEEPDPTPDVDWTKAVSVADALQLNNETVTVKGYIVGTLAKGCPSSIADVVAAADHVEMQDAGSYTGYSTVIIADNADETDLSKCLWVKTNDNKTEFPGADGMTSKISLDKNPGNIGKLLYVKGTKRAMFTGLPGVRDIEGWQLGE